MTCELYRHYAADGTLLYVGVSLSAVARLCTHRRKSPWFGKIASIQITRYASRRDAEIAERAAIAHEKPLWNSAHKPPPASCAHDVGFIAKKSTSTLYHHWRYKIVCVQCARAYRAASLPVQASQQDLELAWIAAQAREEYSAVDFLVGV